MYAEDIPARSSGVINVGWSPEIASTHLIQSPVYVNPRNKSRVLKQRLVNEARLSGEPSEGRFTGRFSKAGCLRPVLATSRQARLSGEPPEGRFTGRFFKAGCLRPELATSRQCRSPE